MRETGGDDGLPRRHRLDQYAGGHLLAGVVGQQHHVGLLHHPVQFGAVEVTGIELHRVVHAQLPCAPNQTVPVTLAMPFEDPGMGLPDHAIPGCRP